MEATKITNGYSLDGTRLGRKTLSTKRMATVMIASSRIGWLIYSAPIVLKRTVRTRSIEIAIEFFESRMLPPINLGFSDESFLKPTMKRIQVNRLRAIVSGIVVNGCEMPITRHNWFNASPANISSATLKPTENKMVSTKLVSFNFKNLRRTNPGTNER
jgi:hypothetical protein